MPDLSAPHRAAVHQIAGWMSERYFRTFRIADDDPAPFDALLQQRDRRVGVTIGALWDDAEPAPGVEQLETLLADELVTDRAIEDGGYVVWVPPHATLPTEEPRLSSLRVSLAKGLAGLAPGARREVRLPVTLQLAKLQDEGAYVSVTGALATEWTTISEGVQGAYHLEARALCRLPEERAEIEIIVSRVHDRAALLNAGEVTDVDVNDTWVVSRLPAGAPAGVTVIAAPPDLDPLDGTIVRRMLRRHLQRATAQRAAGAADMAALVLIAAVGHLEGELATAALRGMNPTVYGTLDLIAVAADGGMRQVLQPRSLPWETTR